jgi:cation-dependent mannose-6-phosphate receptor
MSSNVTLRGRRLALQYINGSPCGPAEKKKRAGTARWTDQNADEDNPKFRQSANPPEGSRRKSALISFHCDKDPLATSSLATFVGVDPDECAYSFEILSRDACIGSEPAKQGAGPATVFVIIGIIAILVYFIGGVFYQRNVSNARGWRQLPNYSMWSGIGNFIKVRREKSVQRK